LSPDIKDLRYDLFLVVVNALLALPGHRFRLLILRLVARVEVGRGSAIERSVVLRSRGGVRIGENCNINHGTVLDGRGGLRIGSTVNISPGVTILTADHDPDSPTFAGRHRPVDIGDRCWVATKAVVLPGTVLGEGAVVGAGAVVRGEVEPWMIVAGNPAQPVRKRSHAAQAALDHYARFLH
jgi:maltose O-acetyltransferase